MTTTDTFTADQLEANAKATHDQLTRYAELLRRSEHVYATWPPDQVAACLEALGDDIVATLKACGRGDP